MARAPKRKPKSVTLEVVRQLALALPETREDTSYGTPAFFVRGKLFARLHQAGEGLVIKIDLQERVLRMQADPETFFITDHYLNHPLMLVRLKSVDRDDLCELIEESWRRSAPKRLVAAYNGAEPVDVPKSSRRRNSAT
jgi:hypothetical protein